MFSPGDRHIGEVAFVVLGIGAAQEDLSAHGTVGVAVQIEAEHWVLNTKWDGRQCCGFGY